MIAHDALETTTARLTAIASRGEQLSHSVDAAIAHAHDAEARISAAWESLNHVLANATEMLGKHVEEINQLASIVGAAQHTMDEAVAAATGLLSHEHTEAEHAVEASIQSCGMFDEGLQASEDSAGTESTHANTDVHTVGNFLAQHFAEAHTAVDQDLEHLNELQSQFSAHIEQVAQVLTDQVAEFGQTFQDQLLAPMSSEAEARVTAWMDEIEAGLAQPLESAVQGATDSIEAKAASLIDSAADAFGSSLEQVSRSLSSTTTAHSATRQAMAPITDQLRQVTQPVMDVTEHVRDLANMVGA